jgi:hypothetical protein
MDQCPICLDTLSEESAVLTSQCGHAVHRTCVHLAVRNGNYTCPICRASYATGNTSDVRNVNTLSAGVGSTDKKFAKFEKMLLMKIPIGAVRQRMEADNIPPLVIDAFLTNGAVHDQLEVDTAVKEHHTERDAQSKDKYVKMLQV